MRKNSMKNTRINGEVQKELAEIIRGEIKDPRISPLTSVISVEVAPDLKTCKAWISVYGDDHVANFVPYVVERVVGGVGAIPQLVLLDVSDDLLPGTGQERTQNTLFDGTNTGEPLDAGSATYINKESA